MIVWGDAQLAPSLAPWIAEQFNLTAYSIKYLGYHTASDLDIFNAAREANAAVLTKDSDFVRLLEEKGLPPKVIWVTLGNTSNARMREVLSSTLQSALALLESGEQLVEIRDAGQAADAGPNTNSSGRQP